MLASRAEVAFVFGQARGWHPGAAKRSPDKSVVPSRSEVKLGSQVSKLGSARDVTRHSIPAAWLRQG